VRIAIVGASGHCGRQLAVQLLDRRLIPAEGRLQLVGHRGGVSETSLWALRTDLNDAFSDDAPAIDVVLEPNHIQADIVVMLAGRTLSTDPSQTADRAALGAQNQPVFEQYATALAEQSGPAPVVIVQSNPVELGVAIFAQALGRHRVIGAGAWSDTLRFRTELARSFKVRRTHVQAWMLGQHGDYLVPCPSQIRAWGVPPAAVETLQTQLQEAATADSYPNRLRDHRKALLHCLQAQRWDEANAIIDACPPDLRTGLRPFLTHFTSAGHTTEVMTAHAVTDLVACLAEARPQVFAAQVQLSGEWLDCHGVLGVPVLLGVNGWSQVCPLPLDHDEVLALQDAAAAIQQSLPTAEA